jgi:hypothetical protein
MTSTTSSRWPTPSRRSILQPVELREKWTWTHEDDGIETPNCPEHLAVLSHQVGGIWLRVLRGAGMDAFGPGSGTRSGPGAQSLQPSGTARPSLPTRVEHQCGTREPPKVETLDISTRPGGFPFHKTRSVTSVLAPYKLLLPEHTRIRSRLPDCKF